jgi:hypothetical protein
MYIRTISHRLSQRLISVLRLGVLLILICPLLVTPAAGAIGLTQEAPPLPLPRQCDAVTPPGEDPPACCAFGYAYYNGEPVAGASVRVESAHGVLTATTTIGGASDDGYYGLALGYPPISATVGSVVTFTVSYSNMVSARTWVVQSDGQQVDLGLIAGYRSTTPVSLPRLP